MNVSQHVFVRLECLEKGGEMVQRVRQLSARLLRVDLNIKRYRHQIKDIFFVDLRQADCDVQLTSANDCKLMNKFDLSESS